MATALDDPEFPVRVQAALVLTELVIVHESGKFLFFTAPPTFEAQLTIYLSPLVKTAVAPQVGKVIQGT